MSNKCLSRVYKVSNKCLTGVWLVSNKSLTKSLQLTKILIISITQGERKGRRKRLINYIYLYIYLFINLVIYLYGMTSSFQNFLEISVSEEPSLEKTRFWIFIFLADEHISNFLIFLTKVHERCKIKHMEPPIIWVGNIQYIILFDIIML